MNAHDATARVAPCETVRGAVPTPPSEEMPRRTVVSLFSGCGGMDLGFRGGFSFGGSFYDRLPFEIVWANDIDGLACDTYAANLGEAHLHRGSIVDVMDTLPEAADVVVGGFPCQDVSINGRRSLANGARTILYEHMIEAIRCCRPKAFVAENVKGLLMSHGKPFFDRMLADFRLPGYTVDHKLYLAAEHGVPQRRERIFIVGVRGDAPFAHPTALAEQMTAQEALADLECAAEDKQTSHIWSKAQRSPEQGNRRLRADKPATTIRAEHHGNVQWHYKLERRISLREAARLQSFPDDFRFVCAMRATERQIGNAVPPVLAWHIAKAVRDHIEHLMLNAAQRLDDALFVEYRGEGCRPSKRIERWLALADGYARNAGWKPSSSLFK